MFCKHNYIKYLLPIIIKEKKKTTITPRPSECATVARADRRRDERRLPVNMGSSSMAPGMDAVNKSPGMYRCLQQLTVISIVKVCKK